MRSLRCITDEIGKTYTPQCVACNSDSRQRRYTCFELSYPRQMANFILRERTRPAAHDRDVCMFRKRAEDADELAPCDFCDLLIKMPGKDCLPLNWRRRPAAASLLPERVAEISDGERCRRAGCDHLTGSLAAGSRNPAGLRARGEIGRDIQARRPGRRPLLPEALLRHAALRMPAVRREAGVSYPVMLR